MLLNLFSFGVTEVLLCFVAASLRINTKVSDKLWQNVVALLLVIELEST